MTRLSLLISFLLAAALSYIAYLTHLNIEETRRNKEALQEIALRVAESSRSVPASPSEMVLFPSPSQEEMELLKAEMEKLRLEMAEMKKRQSAAVPEAAGAVYRVQKGDNLWRISRKLYKTPWKWHALWKANEDRIPNYRKMPAGTVLKLPA